MSVSVCPICGGVREGPRCGRPCLPAPGAPARSGESLDARAPIPRVLRSNRHGEAAEAFVAAGQRGRRINRNRVAS
jgi:hypothetical protein